MYTFNKKSTPFGFQGMKNSLMSASIRVAVKISGRNSERMIWVKGDKSYVLESIQILVEGENLESHWSSTKKQ